MLDVKSVKDLASCKAEGAEVFSATSKTTGKFDYPVFSEETVGNIQPRTLVTLVNRRLRDDYRNAANRPESQVRVLKEMSISIFEDSKMTKDEKLTAFAELHGLK